MVGTNRRWLVLSADEQQAWEDIQRYYDAEAEEPARFGRHRSSRGGPDARGIDDLPAAVVAGVWITIFLVIFGESGAALAVAGATALGWALWRWWPRPDSGPARASSPGGAVEGAGESSIASWQRRLRRLPDEECPFRSAAACPHAGCGG
jgi:hypothetical protein